MFPPRYFMLLLVNDKYSKLGRFLKAPGFTDFIPLEVILINFICSL